MNRQKPVSIYNTATEPNIFSVSSKQLGDIVVDMSVASEFEVPNPWPGMWFRFINAGVGDCTVHYGGSLETVLTTGMQALWVCKVNDASWYAFTTHSAITKAMVEAVLTGTIASHGHAAPEYDFTDLQDVPTSYTDQAGKFVRVNATADGLEFATGGGGAEDFLALSDTPDVYTGQSGKTIVVNATETGLMFVGGGGGGVSTFLDLSDTPYEYTGNAGKIPVVNSAEDSLVFVTPTVPVDPNPVLSSSITYYVDAINGSDTTGDGTELLPFASAAHVVSITPIHFDGGYLTIYLANATANHVETIDFSTFYGTGTVEICSLDDTVTLEGRVKYTPASVMYDELDGITQKSKYNLSFAFSYLNVAISTSNAPAIYILMANDIQFIDCTAFNNGVTTAYFSRFVAVNSARFKRCVISNIYSILSINMLGYVSRPSTVEFDACTFSNLSYLIAGTIPPNVTVGISLDTVLTAVAAYFSDTYSLDAYASGGAVQFGYGLNTALGDGAKNNALYALGTAFSKDDQLLLMDASDNNKMIRGGLLDVLVGAFKNKSIAAQVLTAGTRTYIVGSNLAFVAGSLKVGMHFRWTWDAAKTAAGTGTTTIDVAVGTTGTSSDAARAVFTKPAGTAVADNAKFVLDVIVRAVGTACVLASHLSMTHNLPATGFATKAGVEMTNISSSFNISTATSIGVCVTAGTAEVVTIQMMIAEEI